jgi:hypothetical protein
MTCDLTGKNKAFVTDGGGQVNGSGPPEACLVELSLARGAFWLCPKEPPLHQGHFFFSGDHPSIESCIEKCPQYFLEGRPGRDTQDLQVAPGQ